MRRWRREEEEEEENNARGYEKRRNHGRSRRKWSNSGEFPGRDERSPRAGERANATQSIGDLIDSILPRPFQSVSCTRVTQDPRDWSFGALRFRFGVIYRLFRRAIIFERV